MSLSPSDIRIIRERPLNGFSGYLRNELRRIDATPFPPRDKSGFKVPVAPERIVFTSNLLTAIQYEDATVQLRVESSLQRIISTLKQDFDYNTFRPLIHLVIETAPDAEIWAEVFKIISVLDPKTPEPSAPAIFGETPLTRSTSSYRGKEQTKRNLDRALRYELNGRVYRGVEGYFMKYFGGRSRSKEKIISKLLSRHSNGQWQSFPEPSSQDAFWSWFSQLQADFFPIAPRKFYTTQRTISGGEAKRQLDIFLKDSNQDTCQHDWKDILVVGEHKQSSQNLTELLLQLSRYARDVFAHQPLRCFMHGFFIHGTKMELWNYDRSGAFSSGEFDIHEEPLKFAQAIVGYAFMTKEELGLGTFVTRKRKGSLTITIDKDICGKRQRLKLEEQPFVKQRAIVCRGTTCFRSIDQRMVVKFSWTSDKRPPESEHLCSSHANGVQGVAKLIGYQRITSIAELRKGLKFGFPWTIRGSTGPSPTSQSSFSHSFRLLEVSDRVDETGKRRSVDSGVFITKRHKSSHASRNTSNSLYDEHHEAYDNRLFGCLAISPAGRSLNDFASPRELLTALRDAIKAHQSLVLKAEILHRDISENNIIITDPKQANGFTGMLIDLDLAKKNGSGSSGARHQTGTMEFMAIEVLRRKAHTVRHDLESFFYVLVWICARRAYERSGSSAKLPKDDVLQGWYKGSFEQIALSKLGHMHTDGFKTILSQFCPELHSLRSLCDKIRCILFPLSREGELEIGTPSDATRLYDRIICEFDHAIAHHSTDTHV